MSAAVASKPSPHELPLRDSSNEILRQRNIQPVPKTHARELLAPPADITQVSRQIPTVPAHDNSREETRGNYRQQSIQTIEEAQGDVATFLAELETKRRQLDEQIHRYIKQKDREFKLYERDLRIKYRTAGIQAKESRSSVSQSRSQIDHQSEGGIESLPQQSQSTVEETTVEKIPLKRDPDPRFVDNGIRDMQATRERDGELLGLFMPVYLPLLDGTTEETQRPPSAPAALIHVDVLPENTVPHIERGQIQRANSDPLAGGAEARRPVELKLEKRTSSSGSEPGKNLVSVLKSSPSIRGKYPKRKRVSIIVGDAVVAPSDTLSRTASPEDRQPHKALQNHAVRSKETVNLVPTEEEPQQSEAPLTGEQLSVPEATPLLLQHQDEISAVSTYDGAHDVDDNRGPHEDTTTVPIDSEVMDYELPEDLPSPFAMDEDVEAGPVSQNDLSDNDYESQDRAEMPSPPMSPLSHERPPLPPSSFRGSLSQVLNPNSSTPLAKVRTSSSSSSQPISPGFARPSAKTDLRIDDEDFGDVARPETETNHGFGSFARVSSYMERTASLGESFMQRNAEEMMRRRRSSAPVDKA